MFNAPYQKSNFFNFLITYEMSKNKYSLILRRKVLLYFTNYILIFNNKQFLSAVTFYK